MSQVLGQIFSMKSPLILTLCVWETVIFFTVPRKTLRSERVSKLLMVTQLVSGQVAGTWTEYRKPGRVLSAHNSVSVIN